jgi:hypothetical protein
VKDGDKLLAQAAYLLIAIGGGFGNVILADLEQSHDSDQFDPRQ